MNAPGESAAPIWDALHRRWKWAGRHAIYAKWLGWKYRTRIGWTPHRNVRGERVSGGIVSFGLGYVEWF